MKRNDLFVDEPLEGLSKKEKKYTSPILTVIIYLLNMILKWFGLTVLTLSGIAMIYFYKNRSRYSSLKKIFG